MILLYFYSEIFNYHHSTYYRLWTNFKDYRPSESAWLVPGTDPEDPAYIWGGYL